MLRDPVRAMWDDAQRGEDRADGAATPRPPLLGRRTVRTLALLGIAAVLYGSLAPFRVDHSKTWSWLLHPSALVPGDAISNVLIYIPVGVLARLLMRRRGSWWISELISTLVIAGGLSYATEATQTLLADRVPSWYDVFANALGGVIGAMMAPMAQRMLRNQHAWLYAELRARPFAAATVGMGAAVLFAGLMPFDLSPSPGRLLRSLAHAKWTLVAPAEWMAAEPLGVEELVGKITAAATFGVLAFVMVLASRQAGRGAGAALRYALERSMALATVIEVLQLFTISHVGEPWDLVLAWIFCAAGALAGGLWVRLGDPAMQHPGTVLRLIVAAMTAGVATRLAAGARFSADAAAANMSGWLPMAHQFHRPWSSVLGDYASAFVLYAMLAGLFVLWSRSHGRRPEPLRLVLVTFSPLLFGAMLAVVCGRGFDTAQLVLAIIAAGAACAGDHALFGRRQATRV